MVHAKRFVEEDHPINPYNTPIFHSYTFRAPLDKNTYTVLLLIMAFLFHSPPSFVGACLWKSIILSHGMQRTRSLTERYVYWIIADNF
jgi:hypothetical protein